MSDIVKWGLLVAGIVAIIAMIVALPFVQYIDFNQYNTLLTDVFDVARHYLTQARGLINNFLTPFGISVLTGLIYYLFGKWAILTGIKLVGWAYHFIFK